LFLAGTLSIVTAMTLIEVSSAFAASGTAVFLPALSLWPSLNQTP
jgi:hypothetical protein